MQLSTYKMEDFIKKPDEPRLTLKKWARKIRDVFSKK